MQASKGPERLLAENRASYHGPPVDAETLALLGAQESMQASVTIPRDPDPEVIDQLRAAYHRARPRWDDQERCSKGTGIEAVYAELVRLYDQPADRG